jgi:hypothetical protein
MRFGIFGAAALAVSVFLGTAGTASVANAKVNVTVDLFDAAHACDKLFRQLHLESVHRPRPL